MLTSSHILEFSLLLVAIVTIQYSLVFARRLTMLPLATGGCVAFLISFAADNSRSSTHLALAYLAGLVVSVVLSLAVLIVSAPDRTVHNLALSLVGVSASTLLILEIDPDGGTIGANTRSLMLAEPNSITVAVIIVAVALVYWMDYVGRLKSPLFSAWSVACGGPDRAKLIPASMTGLLFRLAFHVGLGSFLMAVIAIHKGVVTAEELGYGFLFELLAVTLFVNALVAGLAFSSTYQARIWRGLFCAIGAAIVPLVTEGLRHLQIQEGNIGEWRRFVLWLVAIVAILCFPFARKLQRQRSGFSGSK